MSKQIKRYRRKQLSMSLRRIHNIHAFKKGDEVIVFDCAKTREGEWQNAWVSKMNYAIGEKGIITEAGTKEGFHIKFNRDIRLSTFIGWPSFCLKKVRQKRIK